MSPRERAEALGWVRGEGWWRCRTYGAGWQHVLACVSGVWLVRGASGRWSANEDEALAHALLLLDVWLS